MNINASETSLSSKRYILYNLNDMEIIDAKNEHQRASMASLTKIMTVIVAIENIKDYNAKVKITGQMIDDIAYDVVTVGFKRGEVVTYNDLLYGALLPSGADAVEALAVSLSGSESAFVKKMNAKAIELGLKDTSFSNVVGLYGKYNYSTPYDMAQILIYALKNEKFRSVFETKQYKLSNGKVINSSLMYYNRKLGKDLSAIKGAKTGYIEEAMYCLASISTLNNVNYLFVSFEAPNSASHILDHLIEYNYFDKNYSYKNVLDKDDKIFVLKTKYAKEKYIYITSNEDIKKYLKNDYDKEKNNYKYDGLVEMNYFNQKKNIGKLEVYYDGKLMGSTDLTLSKPLHFDVITYLKENNLYVNLILFGVLIFMYIINVILSSDSHFEVDNNDIKS